MSKKESLETEEGSVAPPKLVSRRANRSSNLKLGRTIGEKRERFETANERASARKKDKKKKALRISFTAFGFIALIGVLVAMCFLFVNNEKEAPVSETVDETFVPTIEIVDEDSASTEGKITSRMKTYIGQAEKDFRELGYKPVKAVIPTGAIREVDFYLEGRPGFVKTVIDRGSAVSVEDADRMFHYLDVQGITKYTYIDVRIDGKAYWK